MPDGYKKSGDDVKQSAGYTLHDCFILSHGDVFYVLPACRSFAYKYKPGTLKLFLPLYRVDNC
jgi:hypothetical protein